MFIQKKLSLLLLLTSFLTIPSSQVRAIKDYILAKKELKDACERVDLEEIQAAANYFHNNKLTTEEEKAVFRNTLEKAEKTWPKKKKLACMQLGLSATSFLLSYLCWKSEGNSMLKDYSSQLDLQIKQSQNQFFRAYNKSNFGDMKDAAFDCGALYREKSCQKAEFYGQKSLYGLGTLGLFGSGCSWGYAGLSNLLATDNRNNKEIKNKCSEIITGLPCHEQEKN
jgi:hypothetical protein